MLEGCVASRARGGRRQVVTVKSRYIMDNQTGGTIEVKQLGTPDLDDPAGGDAAHRCAQRLAPNERCAPPARAPAPASRCVSACRLQGGGAVTRTCQ
jgi:hypothetical protein